MTEKQLYDATEVEKVLRTLEKNFMGVSPRGKEQANVVAFVRKHISAIPKVTPGESATADIQRGCGISKRRFVRLSQLWNVDRKLEQS